jgi:universal stress protein E
MDLATSLARLEGSELHVIHTWTMYAESLLRSGRTKIPPTELNGLLAEAQEMHQIWVDQLLEPYELEDINHQVHLLKGTAATLIPQVAQEKEIDLIVMGTVSRTGISGLLIGNTAENVLRQVDCSVLTVKPDGFVTTVKPNNG